MDTKTLNKFTAIKLLLNDAIRAMSASGVQRAFAILHAHDALEWTFQIVYTHLKIGGKKNAKMYLTNYAREIEEREHGLIDQGNVSRLNTLRNNFKHDFLFPDPEQTKEIIYWAENQINTICQRLFNTNLADIDLASAIANDEVKSKINEADKKYSQSRTVDAFCELSTAFEMIKHELQEKIEKATSKRAIFETNFTFYNSFFLKIKEKGRDFARAWDQIIESIEYLVDMSFINFLGMNMNAYFQFQAMTPRPMRMMDGKYHCDISDRLTSRMRASEYQKCRDFVIDAALKAESKIL